MKRIPAVLVCAALVLFAVAAITIGCETTESPTNGGAKAVRNITYAWEPKRQACFALLSSVTYAGHRVVTMAFVPFDEDRCK